ncbi:YcnI family copper-binding membrane protein [Georgenia sunbinii]|uniref:YcnI family copper-binding membrane protein n=1 Tax=Georgenia sunbinii TaxID=3117728 RepID=UPI002F2632F9
MKRSIRASVIAVATAGLIAVGATGAAAHVSVSATTTEAGASTILTFSVPHGCGTSATTAVAIQVPEEFSSVTPTVNHGWQLEKVMETLDPPEDDGHGGQRTERVAEVVYTTDAPLPDGQRDTFELSVRLPETPGTVLSFPVVQTCEEGEAAWVQVPAEGQDAGALEMPAPAITLTAADGDAADAEPATEEATAEPTEEAMTEEAVTEEAAETGTDPAASASDDGAGVPAVVPWVALALGAGGLVLGGLAFARARKA